ncbi:PDR/VanB family oxidoreductase [Nocardia gamkensis]|uniref:Oxidoreductase n=1 Tax=Nocardia gamkensis TaxID=352869 RepID=A0A7X6L146_9NOCA|nr:PDR/VanB family oxidoreductase [Nocardia gamkensis]NKY25773.1 oxidoreductase [Nocardia gamkensis]NQE69043.1 Vanillate O-demethylase oxidoreductase [Nocardia gamkensis]
MTRFSPPPVPPSLRRPGNPDRLMSGLRGAVRGYAALFTRVPIPDPTPIDRELRLVVAENRVEAEGVSSLRLESADGSALPSWDPGAHIDLTLPSGKVRQYSLCGDPAESGSYRVAVRRIPDGGGASIEIHDRLPSGATVTVRGPRNAFPFAYPHLARADISRVVFIAAGIGITPILPMVRAAAAAGVDWHLTYLGRSAQSLAFLGEIDAINSDAGRVRILTGTRPTPAELLAHAGPGTSVYFCGPPGLLSGIRTEFDHTGAAGLHFERFGPEPVVGGAPFEIRLARTAEIVPVPADRSALDAVRETLPDVPYSCRQGFCGTCRVRVLAGEVDRRGRSAFLDESDTMLICTDRAQAAAITIDL